jgi:hypothetical protein
LDTICQIKPKRATLLFLHLFTQLNTAIYKDAEAKEQRNLPSKPEAAEPCNVSNSTFSYNEKGTFQRYGSEKDTWIHEIRHMKQAYLLLYPYGPRPA